MKRILTLLYFASFWWGNYPTCKGTLAWKLFINTNHFKLYQGTMCVLVLESSTLGLWWKYLPGVYVERSCANFFCKNPRQIYIKTQNYLVHKILFLLLKTFNLFLLAALGIFYKLLSEKNLKTTWAPIYLKSNLMIALTFSKNK